MTFAFEELKVYQKAIDFSVDVIDAIDEMETPRKYFKLIEQLETACTSVPSNISEGKGRYSRRDFTKFLYIARGSLYETVARLAILLKKKWLQKKTYEKLYAAAEEINKMISGLINSLQG